MVRIIVFHFGGGKIDIFNDLVLIENAILLGNLDSLNFHQCVLSHSYSINYFVGSNRSGLIFNSSMLWKKMSRSDF